MLFLWTHTLRMWGISSLVNWFFYGRVGEHYCTRVWSAAWRSAEPPLLHSGSFFTAARINSYRTITWKVWVNLWGFSQSQPQGRVYTGSLLTKHHFLNALCGVKYKSEPYFSSGSHRFFMHALNNLHFFLQSYCRVRNLAGSPRKEALMHINTKIKAWRGY